MRIAIEAGTHSPWASRVLEECGHEMLVANARKLRLIYSNKRKTDEVDAENLARLARLDPKLLYPLKHRGEDSQAHMALIRSRQALVDCRTQLVNPGYEGRSSPSGRACPSARPGVRAPATGRGGRAAHGADLRADVGRPLSLREEPQRGRLSGASACQRSVGDRDPQRRISKEGLEMLSVGSW
jgi:hypothetical protein